MPFKLHIRGNDSQAAMEKKIFSNSIVRIGRLKENDVQIKENFVSGTHAEIIKKEDFYYLEDLGSKNGTFLNDKRLDIKTLSILKDSDNIGIGTHEIIFYAVKDKQAEKIPDPERTIIISLIDAPYKANNLALALRSVYSKNLEKDEKERKIALRETVNKHLDGIDNKDKISEILFLTKKHLQGNDDTEEAATWQEKKIEEVSLKAISDIAACFYGQDKIPGAEDEVVRFGERIKETLNLLIENLSERLQAYREFQDQFDVKATKILLLDPNPIKKAATKENIGKFLLDWETDNCETTREALNEVHRDLLIHQLAILKGFKKCFRELLMEVSPSVIENEAKESGIKKFLGKQNMWSRYVEKHKELTENETKTFNVVLNRFQQAYLSFLKENRKRKDKTA